MVLGHGFRKDPEVIGNSNIQQTGVSTLNSLKDKFSGLEKPSRSELEDLLVEAKHVAIQIEGLARQLQGPPAPFR